MADIIATIEEIKINAEIVEENIKATIDETVLQMNGLVDADYGDIAVSNNGSTMTIENMNENATVSTGTYSSKVNQALLIKARKASAGTITKGQVVYITGSSGTHLLVELARADVEATSAYTIGIAATNITGSNDGFVMQNGRLTGLSTLPTATFNDGDALYLSETTAGAYRVGIPEAPNHGVFLGFAVRTSNGGVGEIDVRVDNYQELEELSDVYVTGSNVNDFLVRKATRWENTTPANVKTILAINNVDNTSDLNKPISTATQTALDAKENTITATSLTDYYRGDKTFQPLNKTAVGLGNVDNTSDVNKPISTATQTALNAKQDNLVSGTNIKTINNQSILGSGNLDIAGGGGSASWGGITGTLSNQTDLQTALDNKIDKIVGKGLSTEDYTTAEKNKLAGIEAGAEANTVDSVNGQTGDVVLDKTDIGLSNVDNTSDLNKPISTATQTALNAKQDALVSGTNIKTINGQSVLGDGNLIITGGGDITPPTIPSFTNVVDQELNTEIESNEVTISGDVDQVWPITVRGDGTAQVKVNNQNYDVNGIIRTGDKLKLKMTSSTEKLETFTATLYAPNINVSWTTTTRNVSDLDLIQEMIDNGTLIPTPTQQRVLDYLVYTNQAGTQTYIDPATTTKVCPVGYVAVPGNSMYGTSDFCVAKYQMKAVDLSAPTVGLTTPNTGSSTIANNTTATTSANGRAIASVASGFPIANISQTTAIDYCQNQNTVSGGTLITNAEWMTIARNIEGVASNWTNNAVGSGGLWRGHSDGSPGNALVESTDNDPYSGTGNTNPSIERRTHTLSNGETIWDMSGNVWEWTSDTILGKDQPTGSSTGFAWRQYTAITNYGTLSYDLIRPSNPAWNSTQNMGQIYSDGTSTNNTAFAFRRGGNWTSTTDAGVFTLALHNTPSVSSSFIGFRCVVR